MQWIALCFAPDTENPEDNVAASLTATERCINIHLSDDKGSAGTPYYTNVEEEFVRSSNIAWENRRASITASTGAGYNVKYDLLLFETMMIQLHWMRLEYIMHDFKADISFGQGKGIQERFDELVDRWEKHCKETEHAVTGLADLKSNLVKLIAGAPNDRDNLDEKAKIKLYKEYKDACVAIDNSEFTNQSLGTASLRIADPYWCHELPKRDIFSFKCCADAVGVCAYTVLVLKNILPLAWTTSRHVSLAHLPTLRRSLNSSGLETVTMRLT